MSANSPGDAHHEAWELIPWLVTGRLAPGERTALEEHLQECESCRMEVAAQQKLRRLMRQPDNVDYAPGPSLQKLLWRIDELRNDAPALAGTRPAAAGRPKHRRIARRWPSWLVALQAAVIVILAGAVLFQSIEQRAPLYRTVTMPREERADLRIVFAPGTTAREIQQLLGGAGAVIVDGPSAAGIYSVALASGRSPAAVKAAAEALRAQPDVVFVEAQP